MVTDVRRPAEPEVTRDVTAEGTAAVQVDLQRPRHVFSSNTSLTTLY